MSKHNNYHNYNSYSSANNEPSEEKIHVEEVEETAELEVEETGEEEVEEVLEEIAEPVKEEPKTLIGIVTGCERLNVRKAPNSDGEILDTIDSGSEVVIDEENSTVGFYKVCTAVGLEGFCMKQFVSVQ